MCTDHYPQPSHRVETVTGPESPFSSLQTNWGINWDAETSVGSLQYFGLEMFSSLMRVAAMTLLRHGLNCSWLQSIYWLKYQKILHQQRLTKVQAWKKCQVSWGSRGGKKWWENGCVWITLLLIYIQEGDRGKNLFWYGPFLKSVLNLFQYCFWYIYIYIYIFFLAPRYVRF